MTAITSYATIAGRVKDFGRELKAYRLAHGVDLITAAQRAGMPVADCRAIEAGHTAVPVYSWLRYADALGLRLVVGGAA